MTWKTDIKDAKSRNIRPKKCAKKDVSLSKFSKNKVSSNLSRNRKKKSDNKSVSSELATVTSADAGNVRNQECNKMKLYSNGALVATMDYFDTISCKNNNFISDNGNNFKNVIMQERIRYASDIAENVSKMELQLQNLTEKLQNFDESHDDIVNKFMVIQKKRGLAMEVERLENSIKKLRKEQDLKKFDRMVQPYVQEYEHEQETHEMERNAPRCSTRYTYSGSTYINTEDCNMHSSITPGYYLSSTDSREMRMKIITQECISEVRPNHAPPVILHKETHCSKCNIPYILKTALAAIVCPKCGLKQNYIDAMLPSPYGRDTDNCFHYKRINHLNESLMMFQAKENTVISKEVLEKAMVHLHNAGYEDSEKISRHTIRDTLKDLGLRKHYENESQITFLITGITPPQMTSAQEERMRMRFLAIQMPFRTHCPPERKNFFSYPYVLYKFCEIEGWYQFLPCFRLHKGADKRKYLDKIWKKICEDLDATDPTMPWPYYDTPMPCEDKNIS